VGTGRVELAARHLLAPSRRESYTERKHARLAFKRAWSFGDEFKAAEIFEAEAPKVLFGLHVSSSSARRRLGADNTLWQQGLVAHPYHWLQQVESLNTPDTVVFLWVLLNAPHGVTGWALENPPLHPTACRAHFFPRRTLRVAHKGSTIETTCPLRAWHACMQRVDNVGGHTARATVLCVNVEHAIVGSVNKLVATRTGSQEKLPLRVLLPHLVV